MADTPLATYTSTVWSAHIEDRYAATPLPILTRRQPEWRLPLTLPVKGEVDVKRAIATPPTPTRQEEKTGDVPQRWDPSSPTNMHAVNLSEVSEKWKPPTLNEGIKVTYMDVVILIGVIFVAGITVVWGLAMVKCMHNHECCWQSDGCWGERQKRKRERKREQQESTREKSISVSDIDYV